MTEEDRLLELAEKATPGRWVATDNADVVGFLGSGAVIDIAHVNPFEEMLHAQAYANAAFIAACSPETIKALVEGKRAAEARVAELEAAILRAYDKADLFCDLHYEEAHQASFDRDKDAERKSIGTYHQINQVIDAMQPELATVLKSRRAALTKNGVSA